MDALKNDLQNSKSKFNQMEEAASKFMHHGAGSRAPGQLRSNDKDDDYIRNKHYENFDTIYSTNRKLE